MNSVELELLEHAIETLENRDGDAEDLHYHAFNENYYLIGHYKAEKWLEKHEISAWEAIEEVIEWEDANFGEVNLKAKDINAERIVNLYVYVMGEKVLAEFDLDSEDLLAEMKEALND